MTMKKPLIIIAGPTASGKSELAVMLAKRINGCIISADSMQVYRGMDIGTAKITPDEMQGIEHYLIDVMNPTDDFNIVTFQALANAAIGQIYDKACIPIICGGTGFYIDSVLYNTEFDAEDDSSEYRNKLTMLARNHGNVSLHNMLSEVDEESARKLHPNDLRRVIRALEYYKKTGKKISEHNDNEMKKESEYNFAYFVLTDDREAIYERIDNRVDKMIDNGLVREVDDLKGNGLSMDNVSMHGLGYKEILSYLNGEISLEEAIYILKRDTRHFAKRQLTWYKREKDVIWIDRRDYARNSEMIDYMESVCKDKGLI